MSTNYCLLTAANHMVSMHCITDRLRRRPCLERNRRLVSLVNAIADEHFALVLNRITGVVAADDGNAALNQTIRLATLRSVQW